MKIKKFLLVLIASIAISGAFTSLLARALNMRQNRPAVVRKYVAAARIISAGEVLRPQDLRLVNWPDSAPLQGSFTAAGQVLGRTVLYPIAENQPVIDRFLAASGAGIGLAAKVPDGMRAISVRSDDVVGVGGFLEPGSQVDVLVTYRPTAASEQYTITALQDVRVAAVGQRIEPEPAGKPESVTVVTLFVSPEQAQEAVLASTQGSVHFILRNGADHGQNTTNPVSLSMLGGHGTQPPAAPSALPRIHVASLAIPHASPEIETVLDGNEDQPKQGTEKP